MIALLRHNCCNQAISLIDPMMSEIEMLRQLTL
jgi:hypothetical protein